MNKSIFQIAFILLSALFISSCTYVDNTPGPRGIDGKAFVGIDYDGEPPYSYWDDNPSTPPFPAYAVYYPSLPGVYEFEYFINETEYWFGTYEVWVDIGGPGGSHGERGIDGQDNYLMLICNYDGFYGDRNFYKKETDDSDWIEIETADSRVKMKKTTTADRKPKGQS